MNLRHDTTVLLTLEAGRDGARFVVEESVVPITSLGGAITTMSIIYNAECMSGGTRWRHPRTGEALIHPQYHWVFTDEENQVLADGQLCDCADCEAGLNG